MVKENFIKIYEESFKENWNLPALSNYSTKETITYGEYALEIARLHLLFKECKIRKGDKIALVGKNNIRWCITYMATITYGAVTVPILQDFHSNDIQHILNHSDSVLLFCSDNIWENIDEENIEGIRAAFSINDNSCIYQKKGEQIASIHENLDTYFQKAYPKGFSPESVKYINQHNDTIVLLNYTSGTTGFSKGVMLTGNNLAGNVTYAKTLDVLRKGEKALSFLPLAHAYGCAFNFILPIAVGAHVTLLDKVPSPKILMKALADVKPHIVITVPLIIEKIYRKMIIPALSRPIMRVALNIPFLDNRIYAQIRKKLIDAMGGRFCEVIIGGAALNKEVEDFLYKIKFPFTVGYGMTECAPLISYDHHYDFIPGSCGQILKGIMKVRIDSEDPYKTVGEIQVKGENVMKGYYKYPEATKAVFTKDGWLKTGDLGTIDLNNRIFIRGRGKTMILGASGQNIYPEEIEAKLNNLPYVNESLIIEKNGKLVALIYPDLDAMDTDGISTEKVSEIMEDNRLKLNKIVAPYETVSSFQLFPNEFEKTPKKSIKRYLYQN
ncbi:MAG: AMP-binding protein [Bacteroidales bacterium]|nr:AMP-binding protein [Bacteroidales bacterium]